MKPTKAQENYHFNRDKSNMSTVKHSDISWYRQRCNQKRGQRCLTRSRRQSKMLNTIAYNSNNKHLLLVYLYHCSCSMIQKNRRCGNSSASMNINSNLSNSIGNVARATQSDQSVAKTSTLKTRMKPRATLGLKKINTSNHTNSGQTPKEKDHKQDYKKGNVHLCRCCRLKTQPKSRYKWDSTEVMQLTSLTPSTTTSLQTEIKEDAKQYTRDVNHDVEYRDVKYHERHEQHHEHHEQQHGHHDVLHETQTVPDQEVFKFRFLLNLRHEFCIQHPSVRNKAAGKHLEVCLISILSLIEEKKELQGAFDNLAAYVDSANYLVKGDSSRHIRELAIRWQCRMLTASFSSCTRAITKLSAGGYNYNNDDDHNNNNIAKDYEQIFKVVNIISNEHLTYNCLFVVLQYVSQPCYTLHKTTMISVLLMLTQLHQLLVLLICHTCKLTAHAHAHATHSIYNTYTTQAESTSTSISTSANEEHNDERKSFKSFNNLHPNLNSNKHNKNYHENTDDTLEDMLGLTHLKPMIVTIFEILESGLEALDCTPRLSVGKKRNMLGHMRQETGLLHVQISDIVSSLLNQIRLGRFILELELSEVYFL